MSRRQILVNAVLVLAFIGLGLFCYQSGKTYNILLENLPYSVNGEERPGLEAIYAYIDGGKQNFMLDGDRTVTPGSGKKHVLKIELLDEEDNIIDTREVSFNVTDLGENMSVNVARAYREGTL